MKQFLLFLILSFAHFINAQHGENSGKNEPEIPAMNNNGNVFNSTTNFNQSISLDSTVYETKEIKLMESDKTVYKKSSVKSKSEDSNQNSLNQKKMEFSKTKFSSSTQRTQRTPTTEQQNIMNQQVEEVLQIAPNSFDYNLMYYSSGNYDVKRETELKKAAAMEPENSEVLKLSAANAIVKGDTIEAEKYLQILEEKQIIQPETVDYTQDIIVSCTANSTIITHGFNDSYGVYFNQLNLNAAPNTTIVSLDFMQSSSYRTTLKNKGYQLPERQTVDVSYLKSFCELNQDKNIALSMTIPKEYFEPIKNNIFVSGLIFEYKPSGSQSTSYEQLDDLWYNKMNKRVVNNYISPLCNSYSKNYLPMLIFLQEHHKNDKDKSKYNQLTSDIDRIKKKAGLKNTSIKKSE